LITKYMLDTGAHLRAGRVGGLLRLTEFAIATGPAMNTALQAAVTAINGQKGGMASLASVDRG
jgi:hypothetical protein